MQDPFSPPWAIVLAAGAGTRLSQLTADATGHWVPKQYCSLGGRSTLLQDALLRARCAAPPERTLVVVAAEHERWWSAERLRTPAAQWIVQPANRGTAAGLLLPLQEILGRDPRAVVSVLPSDHAVEREDVFASTLRRAVKHATGDPASLVLLGITPDEPDREYGWIVPEAGPGVAVRRVRAFVEKPDAARAQELFWGGALWSSFVFTTGVQSLVERMRRTVPELTEALIGAPVGDRKGLERRYLDLPVRDFSRDVLQADLESLHLLAVPTCGWTDLGTPRRVAECLERRDLLRQSPRRPAAAAILDLRTALARWNSALVAG